MVPFSFSGKCYLSNHQATVWPAFFIPNSLLVRFPLLSPIELWARLVALFPKNHRRIVFIQPKQQLPTLAISLHFIIFHSFNSPVISPISDGPTPKFPPRNSCVLVSKANCCISDSRPSWEVKEAVLTPSWAAKAAASLANLLTFHGDL